MEVEIRSEENGDKSCNTAENGNADAKKEKDGSSDVELKNNDTSTVTKEKEESKENVEPEDKMETEIEEKEKTGTNDNQKESKDAEAGTIKPTENGIDEDSEKNDGSKNEETETESLLALTLSQNEEMEDDDDDFNPLLLCPDISMDVDESPVVTTSESASNDLTDSNALFAPLFSTFVDEMTGAEISFNLTAEEQQLREKLYGPNNPIEFSKVHCTACNVHLGSALAGQTNRFVHPLLKVLICKECYHFYTSGEFEKDEDGSELYCRWCGQGGQVLCCSKCEFVFCKKCIRINFGRKKLTEVRDSDEWNCFRCDMSQLKTLRAMCVEFFEYVRRETARASSMKDPDFINKDLTNCCQTQLKKRLGETEETEKEKEVKRSKRRRTDEDPDYNPFAAQSPENPPSPVPSTSGVSTPVNTSKPLPPLLPKPASNEVTPPVATPSPTIRIGSSVYNVNASATSQAKNSPTIASVRTATTAVRSPTAVLASRPRQTYAPRTPTQAASPRTPIVTPVGATPAQLRPSISRPGNRGTTMKHEWFEKTVRAAARVNSNLSYTLTQLNKAQASASSVEQLAVVHNKLQEILSSSINSLIQIRKNLRTEFIAGIKTIRFPPKPPVDPNDDDVIIVNSSTPDTPKSNDALLQGLSQITVKKNLRTPAPEKVVTNNDATTPKTSVTTPTRGYLKVKSFSQLQTVTSECITIPDDDPPKNDKDDDPVIVSHDLVSEMEKDPLADDPVEVDQHKKNDPEVTLIEDENTSDANSEKNVENSAIKDREVVKNKDKEDEDKDKEKAADDKHQEKDAKDKNEKENSKDDADVSDANGKEDSSEISEKGEINEKDKEEDKNDKDVNEKNKKEDANNENENENSTTKKSDETNRNSKDVDDKKDDGTKDGETKDGVESNCVEKLSNGTSDAEVSVKKEPEDDGSYNVKDKPSPKIRRMLSVKVNLKKTPVVEDMVKQEPVENGTE